MAKLKIDQFIETYGVSGISLVLKSITDEWCKDRLSSAQIGLIYEGANKLEEALKEYESMKLVQQVEPITEKR